MGALDRADKKFIKDTLDKSVNTAVHSEMDEFKKKVYHRMDEFKKETNETLIEFKKDLKEHMDDRYVGKEAYYAECIEHQKEHALFMTKNGGPKRPQKKGAKSDAEDKEQSTVVKIGKAIGYVVAGSILAIYIVEKIITVIN